MNTQTRTVLLAARLLFAPLAVSAACKDGFAPDPDDAETCVSAPGGDVVRYKPSEQNDTLGVTHQERTLPDGGKATWDSYYTADLNAALGQKTEGALLVGVGPDGKVVQLDAEGQPLVAGSAVAYYQVNTAVKTNGKVEPCKTGFELQGGVCVSADPETKTTTTYDPKEQENGYGVTHQEQTITGDDGKPSVVKSDSYYLGDLVLAQKIVDSKNTSDHEATLYRVGADGKPVNPGEKVAYYQINVLPKRRHGAGKHEHADAGPCPEHPEFVYDATTKSCRQEVEGTVVTYDPDTAKTDLQGSRSVTRTTANSDGSKTTVKEYYLLADAKGRTLEILWELKDSGHEVKAYVTYVDADGKTRVGEWKPPFFIIGPDGKEVPMGVVKIEGYQVNEKWTHGPASPGATAPVVTVPTRAGYCDGGHDYAVPGARCVSEPAFTSCGGGAFGGTGHGTGMGPFGGAACCDDSVCAKGFQCVFNRAGQTGDTVKGTCQAQSAGDPWHDPKGLGRPCAGDSGCMSGYCNPRLGICDARPLDPARNPLVKGVYGVGCDKDDQCYPGLQCGPDKFCQWAPPAAREVTPRPGGKCTRDKDCALGGRCNSITLSCLSDSNACTRNEDCDSARGMRCIAFACQQDLKTKTELGLTGGTLPPDSWGRPQTYCGAAGQDDCFKAGLVGMECNFNICRGYDPDFGLSARQEQVRDAVGHIRGMGMTPGALVMTPGICPGVTQNGTSLIGSSGDKKRDAEAVAACGQGDPDAGKFVAGEVERIGRLLGITGIKCGVQTVGGGPFAWNVVNCDIPGCTDAFTQRSFESNGPALLGYMVDGAGFKDKTLCTLTAGR